MQHRVQKWGNSLGIRIPKSFSQKLGLEPGTPIEFKLRDNAITIRPKRYSLETLLAQVSPENLHGETETGAPVGREIW
jgi:antitoxin MazE